MRLSQSGNGNAEAVVASILALAKALDLEALAEGIEAGARALLGRPGVVEDWG